MKTDYDIQNLVSLSREFSGTDWVQAAGGNVSVKQEQSITIKKSGLCFKDIYDENGFISINLGYEDLLILLNKEKNPHLAQIAFDHQINNLVTGEKGRPSLELSFHLLGGKYVLHLHPTVVNILGCSVEGQEILLEIEKNNPDFLCVNYVKPGLALTAKIYEELKKRNRKRLPKVTFLFNHGLILSAENPQKIKEALAEALSKIHLHAENIFLNRKDEKSFSGFLYPDAAVYCWDSLKRDKEVWENHNQVYQSIIMRKWNPVFLSENQVSELLNWDAEKYRQKMVKK